ncbi:MAG: hypothetical protein DWQ01_06870 [Planctomycetota bacterium]|nr:MAG: hypothetical protein DWQ01_06870 [Planctomycetota bacterium]
MLPLRNRTSSFLSMVLLAGLALGCQNPGNLKSEWSDQGLNRGPFPLPTSVSDQEDWQVREVLVQTGPLWIAGQPSEQDFERFAEEGVQLVVNLRTPAEMDNRQRVPFDEAEKVRALGMEYLHIPLGGDDFPYDPDAVDRFAEALARYDTKALLHCTVAWRASHLWAAYLVRHHGWSLDQAMEHAKAINFGDLPLEGLLGRPIQFVVN